MPLLAETGRMDLVVGEVARPRPSRRGSNGVAAVVTETAGPRKGKMKAESRGVGRAWVGSLTPTGRAYLVPGDQQGSIVGPGAGHPALVGNASAGGNDRSRVGPLHWRDDHGQRSSPQGQEVWHKGYQRKVEL
ncbi:hypothetical protein NDU88_002604 [Pleurodeles waltl]|uniref:Uncharacterized protein n=1 Tax=Pleurodeles waltl TaxID=8319 RepID=A0AAV7T443_PLEWA|nr:hypothetical protein NDU88_002604 [Pleurodeles waltl]